MNVHFMNFIQHTFTVFIKLFAIYSVKRLHVQKYVALQPLLHLCPKFQLKRQQSLSMHPSNLYRSSLPAIPIFKLNLQTARIKDKIHAAFWLLQYAHTTDSTHTVNIS